MQLKIFTPCQILGIGTRQKRPQILGTRQNLVLGSALRDILPFGGRHFSQLAEKEGRGTGVKLNGRLLDNLRFADDIDLMADMKERMQDLTNRVNKSSKRMGLKINAEKTKTMAIGKQHRNCKCNWEQGCWNRSQDLSIWED